jgi:hypothetical protein
MTDAEMLQQRCQYLSRPLKWAMAFALNAPRGVPRFLVKTPLNAVLVLYSVHFKLLLALGYRGHSP